jgi:hypothetical protein
MGGGDASSGYTPIILACAVGVPTLAACAYWLSWKSYDFIPIKVSMTTNARADM